MERGYRFDFGWGSAPDPALDSKGPTCNRREGEEDRGQEDREGFFLYI